MSKDQAVRTEMPVGDGSRIWFLMCTEELMAFLSEGGSPSAWMKAWGKKSPSGIP